tara:strand:+ start:1496 stop:1987 length:492 start_codon:yes stop_codon:yes gene_type:complete
MENEVCSDTGPILHLNEINQTHLLNIFNKIFISAQIKEELQKYNISKLYRNIKLININKDQVALIAERFNLDIGESSTIYLAKSLKKPVILTDDLYAREVSKSLDLKPVGTIGIILRSYRQKLITKEKTIKILIDLHKNSTLFVTDNLIKYAIDEVNKFKFSK